MNELIQTIELRNKMESANPPLTIDVRLAEDFNAAHIPGAINNCVYEVAFHHRMQGIIPDLTRDVVVYGQNAESYEGRFAAEKLGRAGYTHVYEYRDGLAGWQAAGAPVEKSGTPPAEAQIADGTHPIDLMQSRVEWTGRNLLNKHYGRIGLKSGQLEFHQSQLTGGRIVLDMGNIVCIDLNGTPQHDVLIDHLRSDDFFDVERFPEASLVIGSVRKIENAPPGQLNLEVNADLTLKGVTAPLTFSAASGVTREGKAAAQATLSFDRTRWNVLYGSARFFYRVGMHLVNDHIDLDIKIVTA
ncbi:MAG: YceI family protein [Verrucomicrobia bacterium]|nr:YceI family protein [Verrucomicrobiota bacterium]